MRFNHSFIVFSAILQLHLQASYSGCKIWGILLIYFPVKLCPIIHNLNTFLHGICLELIGILGITHDVDLLGIALLGTIHDQPSKLHYDSANVLINIIVSCIINLRNL